MTWIKRTLPSESADIAARLEELGRVYAAMLSPELPLSRRQQGSGQGCQG